MSIGCRSILRQAIPGYINYNPYIKMKITRQIAITAFRGLTSGISFENEVNKYAASRNIKKLKSTAEEVEEHTQEKRLEHCFKDKDQCPVKDENGNMKFPVDKEKQFKTDIKKYLDEEIEFEPYKFRSNTEILKLKYFFINSDIEFLLDDAMLVEPAETNGSATTTK